MLDGSSRGAMGKSVVGQGTRRMTTAAELLEKGIRAAKAGRVHEALALLRQVIERQPRNQTAWLWLSEVVETDEERIVCLETVLAINPENKAAQRGLSILRRRSPITKPLPKPAEPLSQPTRTAPGELAQAEVKLASTQCYRCGSDNPPGSEFCRRCGVMLREAGPTEVGLEAKPEDAGGRSGRAWTWLLAGGTGAVLLILVGFVLAWASGLFEVQGVRLPVTLPTDGSTPTFVFAADDEYVDCSQVIRMQWAALAGEVADGAQEFISDPGDDWPTYDLFCDEQRPQFKRTLHQIEQRHSECPLPTDPHLQAARRHTENGLSELAAAIEWYEKYCDELLTWSGESLPYLQGNQRLRESNELADRAAEEIDKYGP